MLLAEVVPPNFQYSGIMVNPLVISMAPGRQALVSIKYTAGFRDLTAAQMNNIKNPKGINGGEGENADGMPKGLVQKNKKILERLEKKKAEAGAAAQQAAGAGAAAGKKGAPAPAQPAPAGAKVDPKAAAANSNIGPGGREIIVPKGKTREQVIAEMEAEEEKKRQEAEEAERQRLAELEKGFDKNAELEKMGGRVYEFYPDDRKS